MELKDRLLTIAKEIPPGSYPVDVGTDHGYLPAYLVKQGIVSRALASDIGEGPLLAAKQHIEALSLSDRIELCLCDGLTGIDLSDKTHIVIAGMGGETISEILLRRHPLTQTLLLQPMTKVETLRRFLLEHGYRIEKEIPAYEEKKAYTVMLARYDGIVREGDDFFWTFGALPQSKKKEKYLYFQSLLSRLEKKQKGLQKAQTQERTELDRLAILIAKAKEYLQEEIYDHHSGNL